MILILLALMPDIVSVKKMKIIPKQKKMKRIQAFFVSIMWLHKTAFFYLLDTA